MQLAKSLKNYSLFEQVIWLLIVMCALAKLGLAFQGFLSLPDETRVFASANFIESVAEGEWSQAVADLFSTQSRPGAVVLNLIPTGLQYLSGQLFDLATFHSYNNWGFFAVNILVYWSILLLLFKCSIFLVKNRGIALLTVFSYGCLTNGYIYLRHGLPYDKSLLIFLVVLWQLIKHQDGMNRKRSLGLGVLAFFGFLVYPGYLLFYGLLYSLMLVNIRRDDWKPCLYQIASFALGGGLLLLLTEALSRIGGVSYIAISSTLSNTIVQGDFKESYLFLLRYLWEVEGVLGGILIVGCVRFALRGALTRQPKYLWFLFIGTFGLFAAYATYGYIFEKVTVYGRLLHQFLPVWILLASVGMLTWTTFKMRRFIAVVIIIVGLTHFVSAFKSYLRFAYPLDVAWKFESRLPNLYFVERCELAQGWSGLRYYKEQMKQEKSADTLLMVNGCYFYPVGNTRFRESGTAPSSSLLFKAPHFKQYSAYLYEGLRPEERLRMKAYQLQIKVYD